jgi:2-polyprenyl-3-methyl-5-hydroxy-6-metoxy-1,4-benzoquinol methylase
MHWGCGGTGPLPRSCVADLQEQNRNIVACAILFAMAFSEVEIRRVRDYWNARPCNIRHSTAPVGTKQYFDEVEARKYFVEPHIPAFAEFERWRGKKVLEIGCGIGTDTINFARHSARVTTVDLSEQSMELARQRAAVFGLSEDIRFCHGNAEELATFVPVERYDLIYSFGVIHHTPHPERCWSNCGSMLGRKRR